MSWKRVSALPVLGLILEAVCAIYGLSRRQSSLRVATPHRRGQHCCSPIFPRHPTAGRIMQWDLAALAAEERVPVCTRSTGPSEVERRRLSDRACMYAPHRDLCEHAGPKLRPRASPPTCVLGRRSAGWGGTYSWGKGMYSTFFFIAQWISGVCKSLLESDEQSILDDKPPCIYQLGKGFMPKQTAAGSKTNAMYTTYVSMYHGRPRNRLDSVSACTPFRPRARCVGW